MPSSTAVSASAVVAGDRRRARSRVRSGPRPSRAPPAGATQRERVELLVVRPTAPRPARPRCPAGRAPGTARERRARRGQLRGCNDAPIGTRVMSRPRRRSRGRTRPPSPPARRSGTPAATTALPVDRRAGHRSGKPGGERGVATHVQRLLADLQDAPMTTSSTSAGSRSLRSRAASCARRGRRGASGERAVARPSGVRTASMITARRPWRPSMAPRPSAGSPERLGGRSRPMRNLDKSLGDGGMPLLEELGRLVRALRRGWPRPRGRRPSSRATCRCRARRRLRRGARRGDELRDAARSSRGDRAATLDLSYQTCRAAVEAAELRGGAPWGS